MKAQQPTLFDAPDPPPAPPVRASQDSQAPDPPPVPPAPLAAPDEAARRDHATLSDYIAGTW